MKNNFIKLSVFVLLILSIGILTACDDNNNIKTKIVTAIVSEKEYTPRSGYFVGIPGKGGHYYWKPERFKVKVEYKDCYHWFNDEKLYNTFAIGDKINVTCQIEVLSDGRVVIEIIE